MGDRQNNLKGLRIEAAKSLIRAYPFSRGKDRVYLILRSLLRLPSLVTTDITENVKLNLDLDDFLQRWTFCHNLEDETDYFWMSRFLREGDSFIDVGANIGIVSIIAARIVGEAGCVYAIEALPQTREALEKNIDLNKIQNIKVVAAALLDEDRTVEIFASNDGNIGGSSISAVGDKAIGISVSGRSLNSLQDEGIITKCDVMKMDIEGAEMLALRGMSNLFSTGKPRGVMIEISETLLKQFDTQPEEILSFFEDLGYEWYSTSRKGFTKFCRSELRSFNNLWAIQPNVLTKELKA